MALITSLVALLQESVGTAGAVANCRRELERNTAAEQQVDALARRLPPPASALRRSA